MYALISIQVYDVPFAFQERFLLLSMASADSIYASYHIHCQTLTQLFMKSLRNRAQISTIWFSRYLLSCFKCSSDLQPRRFDLVSLTIAMKSIILPDLIHKYSTGFLGMLSIIPTLHGGCVCSAMQSWGCWILKR